MKRMLLVTLGVAAALVFSGSAFAQDAKVEKGMKVYADQKCSMCHSIAGKANAKGALDDVGSRLTVADIKLWLTDPAAMTAKTQAERKPMMKVTAMPPDEVDALVAYMSSLKKK
jgi:mono/diheme cytochrome c family protein